MGWYSQEDDFNERTCTCPIRWGCCIPVLAMIDTDDSLRSGSSFGSYITSRRAHGLIRIEDNSSDRLRWWKHKNSRTPSSTKKSSRGTEFLCTRLSPVPNVIDASRLTVVRSSSPLCLPAHGGEWTRT